MKKYLAIAAAAATVCALEANAGFEVGVGVSSVNFGGETTISNGTDAKRDTASSNYAGDLTLGYKHIMGKWHVGAYGFVQTGGGEAVYSTAAATYGKLERKYAYGFAARAGMEVAPKSSVFVTLGTKNGRFEITHGTTAANRVKKQDNVWGLMAGLGFEHDLSDKFAINLAYEYVDYGSIKSKVVASGHLKADVTEHNARLGVVYKF